jgi:cell division protein FtsB
LDALSERSDDKKEIEELTGRIERLEREIKRLDDGPGAPGQR